MNGAVGWPANWSLGALERGSRKERESKEKEKNKRNLRRSPNQLAIKVPLGRPLGGRKLGRDARGCAHCALALARKLRPEVRRRRQCLSSVWREEGKRVGLLATYLNVSVFVVVIVQLVDQLVIIVDLREN